MRPFFRFDWSDWLMSHSTLCSFWFTQGRTTNQKNISPVCIFLGSLFGGFQQSSWCWGVEIKYCRAYHKPKYYGWRDCQGEQHLDDQRLLGPELPVRIGEGKGKQKKNEMLVVGGKITGKESFGKTDKSRRIAFFGIDWVKVVKIVAQWLTLSEGHLLRLYFRVFQASLISEEKSVCRDENFCQSLQPYMHFWQSKSQTNDLLKYLQDILITLWRL